MAYFTVMVIGDDPETQMLPFQDNTDGKVSQEFLEFEDLTQDVRDRFNNRHDTDPQNLHEYALKNCYIYDKKIGAYGYWFNPNARWDWYEVADQKLKKQLISSDGCFAIIFNGEWFSKEDMYRPDWSDTKEELLEIDRKWEKICKGIISLRPGNTLLTFFKCHM